MVLIVGRKRVKNMLDESINFFDNKQYASDGLDTFNQK